MVCIYAFGTVSSIQPSVADFLLRLCRVWGDYINSTRSTSRIYCCANYASDLMMVFGINLATASHPASFCCLCHQVVTAYKNASAHCIYRTYKVCTIMFDGWESHSNDMCCVCKHGKRDFNIYSQCLSNEDGA